MFEFGGQSGKHMLALSSSQFDPQRTFGWPRVNGVSVDLDQAVWSALRRIFRRMIDWTHRWVFVAWYTWVATLVCVVAYLIFG
jgi:hypothetical protein